MGILLWILIGLGAGLIIAVLAPENASPTRSESAGRWLRDTVAGAIGAIAAGFAFRAFNAEGAADGLTSAFASLAGGLWIAAIAEAFASRRRDDRHTDAPVTHSSHLPNAIDMPAYDSARQALVAGLLEDAAAHDAGRYGEIGRQLPAIRDSVAREDPVRTPRLHLALRFWSGWTEARNRHWLADADQSIARDDWSRLARALASDLALDRDASDPVIAHRFA